MRRLIGLVLLSVSLVVGPAHARGRPVIVVLISQRHVAVLPRLQAELSVAGFDLRLRQAPAWPPSREQAEQVARAESAIAALAFVPDNEANLTEVWVVDRVTGKTIIRSVPQQHPDDLDVLAIAAVEALRATLMEIDLPQGARGEVPPPPAVQKLVTRKPSRFGARVAAIVNHSPGGLGASASLGLAAMVAVNPRLRLGIDGALPLTTYGLTAREGRAQIRPWFAGAFFEVTLTNPAAWWGLNVGGGAWLAALDMNGTAPSPYVGRSLTIATWSPHADAAWQLRLTPRMNVTAQLSAAFAARQPIVRFASRDVAIWGRPLLLGALGLNVWLD
jgi:hypothetical protein